jgi:SET domain-containing protein
MKMYRPLPPFVTIAQSGINGLGLFAKEDIAQGANLGTSHIKIENDKKEDEIFRTPLGGFINHANEANCVKVELHDDRYKKKWNLIALKNIKEGEELTVRYTFYNV